MDEILVEFVGETKSLVEDMTAALEVVEEDPTKVQELERFGQVIDRIMGGAKTIALDFPAIHPIHTLANFAELCKVIGYKASQVHNNSHLITVVVSFLFDATETIEELLRNIEANDVHRMNSVVTATFLDRLKWLTQSFDESLRATVATSSQEDINDLLRKLGVTST
jgi:hypothetical protein